MASIMTGTQLDSNLGRNLINAEREVSAFQNNLSNLQNAVSVGFNSSSVQRFQQEVQGVNMALQQVSGSVERLQQGSEKVGEIWDRACKSVENLQKGSQEMGEIGEKVSKMAGNINKNTEAQKNYNKELENAEKYSQKVENAIKRIAGKYLSFQSISNVLGMSDNMINMSAKVDVVNDGQLSTQELTDAIYASAQRAYVPFLELADAVAVLGNTAGQEFGSSMEMVAFLEQANKQMALGGADAQQQSNALTQLTRAMQEGTLQGSSLNAVLAAAPGIGEAIEQSMGWAEGSLKSYAEQGMVTAQVVKNSLLGMSEETNERFAAMPATFSQAAQNLQNSAVKAFQPLMKQLSEMINSEGFMNFVQGAAGALAVLASVASRVFGLIGNVAAGIAGNWSVIGPLVYGVIAAMGVYYGIQVAAIAMEKVSRVASLATAAAKLMYAVVTGTLNEATKKNIRAQYQLNMAMLASPAFWITMLIIALIAVIIALAAWIGKATGTAQAGFGTICGAVNVVITYFENLFLCACNVFIGIFSAVQALRHNMSAVFDAIAANLISIWSSILAKVLTVIADICDAISNLPFIDIDSSRLREMAECSEEIAENLKNTEIKYENPLEAFWEGVSTFNAFEDGWQKKAFEQGAAWGDGMSEKVSGFFKKNAFGIEDIPGLEDYKNLKDQEELFDNVGIIADNTSNISDAVSVSQEDLGYLRDLAAQEAVNRYTTASINVEMNTHNNISREADLDGIVDGLTGKVLEAMELVQEGV